MVLDHLIVRVVSECRFSTLVRSLPDGYRSLNEGAAVLVAQDADEATLVGQAMAAQELSARLGSIPGGTGSLLSWKTRVRLAIFMRRLSEYFPSARFDLASVFKEFGQRIEQGLKEGDLFIEGFEYGNWQVEFILIRLNGVDTYAALKIPRF